MKILHVLFDLAPSSGGPAKAGVEMCNALAKAGNIVSIYTTDYKNSEFSGQTVCSEDQVEITYFPIDKWSISKWPVSLALAHAIRKNIQYYDIVEIHSLYLFHTLVTAYYCRKYNIPYLIRPHGSLDPFLRKKNRFVKAIYHFLFENRNLNRASAIHYTAEDEKNLAHFPLKIKAPAIIVPLGLNANDYANLPKKGRFRSKYPDLADKIIILYLGRINFKKGLDLLTKAFQRIAVNHPEARLVIAGPEDKGYGDKVHQWVQDYGIADKTIFTGMLLGEEKLAAFVDADLFVLPSYTENFGITIIEAMACGVPVVITDKVNIWREITNVQAGEVIQCNVPELESAIVKLIEDQLLRERYGSNGRRAVPEKFTWESTVQQLITEYQKIILINNRKK